MTDWIEFSHDWAYYITPSTFEMKKVRGKVPVGSIVLRKQKEILDTGMTIVNTEYSIVKEDTVVDLEDKRAANEILAKFLIGYMKEYNEYPPGTVFDKAYKNGNVDVLYKASEYDRFKIRLTSTLVGSDPEEFLMNLRKAGRKKFIPGDDWKIEPAKSSRASCKTCGHNIEKGDLRLGEPTYFQDHLNYKWHHFDCKADDIWGIPKDKLLGYSSLESKIKESVEKALWM
ncbi:hypothetical protein EU528_02685 [Candidatus Thorarchaeota archaeon]|nr:MAG: hypothetical protein EU528_02685 [Candidatus Thorarchaeota archaeon]